jgi:capsular polysaccharide transport system permease protein
MAIVFGALIVSEGVPGPHEPLRILEAIVLLAFIGFGYGFLCAVIITRIKSWHNISRLMMTPLMFLSGVLAPIGSLPTTGRTVVSWNPIAHGIEMFRDGYYVNFRSETIDAGYLATWGILLVVLGLVLDRTVRARVE